MRQIIAAVTRKLLLTIFAPVTVGLLITASASAEPKGSFELPSSIGDITMVNVVEAHHCERNGDIGVNSAGLILSCQSNSWKLSKGHAEVDYSQCTSSPGISHWSGTNYLSQCPTNYIAVGIYAWAGGDSAHTRVTSTRCCKVR